MTTLEITPRISDKTARFRGTVAAGEHVAVTIKGGAEWLGDDNGAHLSLRVIDFVTGRTLALFPRPEETLEDGDEPDEWSTSAEDPDDLFCNLNLNTDRMVNAARHMLRVPVLFVMGAKDDENPAATRTLYFRDRYEVEFWPERVGDDTPYDLDRWPKQIDEWTELVAEFGTRLTTAETNISQAEGRVNAAINAIPQTVQTAVVQSNSGKADKVANATNGNLAALDANGNLDDSGKKPADFADAAQFAAHKDNTTIHITATERSTWNAKYDKPSGGIPKSDLAEAVQTSLGKADTAIQEHQSLAAYVNGGVYDGDAKKILLKHDSVTVAEIDATAFIKDGMISEVKIVSDNLVIVFNADAGKESISIPLTQIFNPANFYDKTAADGRFVQKEAGKGLSANDYTTSEKQKLAEVEAGANKTVVDAALSESSTNPVQNKVIATALETGYTAWTFDPPLPDGVELGWYDNGEGDTGWAPKISSGDFIGTYYGTINSVDLSWDNAEWDGGYSFRATRTRITPTKTSQLANDGDGTSAFATVAQVAPKANFSDVAAALALKADASSLPYALVGMQLSAWMYSWPEGADGAPFEAQYSNGAWTFNNPDNSPISVTAAEDAMSLTFTASDVNGISYTLTATRGYQLTDRAINAVTLTSDATLVFPAQTAGKARDFLVRLTIPAGDAPQIAYPEGVTFENADGSFPEINTDESAAASTLLLFTETAPATGTGNNATPARFLVKGEALKEVS